ncbi:MAG: YCF48-related protein [Burkholderiaceae bacterium]|nr:YCF48-related protein [Burkholderiaceae bacterium]
MSRWARTKRQTIATVAACLLAASPGVSGTSAGAADKAPPDAPAGARNGPNTAGASGLRAQKVAHPERAPLMAATRAGSRIVAVGDFGTVLLSDDEGASWRQATDVPTRVTLTAVQFLDAKQGWAVGHGGLVLASADGGEHWRIAHRAGTGTSFFSVRFADAEHGLVVGAFGAAIATDDGGKTWDEIAVGQGEFSDRHLYQIFSGPHGTTWIAAESGVVYRSTDARAFAAVSLPYRGSIWGGMALPDGAILVWGMGGHVLRSPDSGASWREIPSGTENPLTAGLLLGKRIVLVGLGGAVLTSDDLGASFRAEIRPDRLSYTAAVDARGAPLLTSLSGVATSRQ